MIGSQLSEQARRDAERVQNIENATDRSRQRSGRGKFDEAFRTLEERKKAGEKCPSYKARMRRVGIEALGRNRAARVKGVIVSQISWRDGGVEIAPMQSTSNMQETHWYLRNWLSLIRRGASDCHGFRLLPALSARVKWPIVSRMEPISTAYRPSSIVAHAA